MGVLLIGLGLVVVGVFVGVLAMVAYSTTPHGVARSLSMIDAAVDDHVSVSRELPFRPRLVTPLHAWMVSIARALSPNGTEARLAKLLDQAGSPEQWTVDRLLTIKGAALFVGGFFGLFVGGGLTLRGILIAAAVAVALFFVPDFLAFNLVLHRRQETGKGLSEALDMLTVCVEAGLGFDAALLQVARNLDTVIAGEFARVLSEIQIGKSRTEAFQALGERLNTPDIRNFVTALVQADRLGLPIAGVLREQTAAMRLMRRQRAEEKAQKTTIKILFPLIFCIFPSLFIVVVGPGAIRLMNAFGHM